MESIKELLNTIESNELVLPAFQREFEWDKDNSKSLIVSLYNGYPIGSILRWKTETPPAIKNDAIDRNRVGLFKVLLDGQQRLTVLYLFIKDNIPPYYEERELSHDPRRLYFNIQNENFQYETEQISKSPEWVKVTDCFRDRVNHIDIAEKVSNDDSEFRELIGVYDENLDKIQSIADRDIPIQNLGKSSTVHEAIEVFDKINTEGTPLNQAQITLAHMSAQWPHIRRNIKEKQLELEERGFDFELDFYVKCIVAVTTQGMTYEQAYDIKKETLKSKWNRLADDENGIFDFFFNILEEEAHIPDSSYLSSRTVLIPFIAYLENKEDLSLSRDEKNEFFRWMYLSLMWGRYSGSSDTNLDNDLVHVYSSDDPIDELVEEIRQDKGRLQVEETDLRQTGRQSRFYEMLKILTRANNPIDWKSGEPLNKSDDLQSHHIFPTSQLYGKATDESGRTYNSDVTDHRQRANEIANRAIITPRSNQKIGNNLPSEYLPEVAELHPDALGGQFIPEETSLWDIENYEEFLAVRRDLIANELNAFITRLIRDEREDDSIDPKELIERDEGKHVEFKETLLYHTYKEAADTDLRAQAIKEICAFMNSEGGYLVIGVADDGTVKGLDRDLQLMNNNIQKFEEQLEQEANNRFGSPTPFSVYVNDLQFPEVDGKTICVVPVEFRPNGPVYYNENDETRLPVRSGSSSRSLPADQINDYIEDRWN